MSDLRCSSAAGAVARMLGVMLLLGAPAATENQIICPRADTFDASVNIDSYDAVMRFDEISGIALSKQYVSDAGNPVLYGMSDIGGGDRLGVWDSVTGERLVSLEIPEPNNGKCTGAEACFRLLFRCGCTSLLIFINFWMHRENRLGINVFRILWQCKRNMYLHWRYRR